MNKGILLLGDGDIGKSNCFGRGRRIVLKRISEGVIEFIGKDYVWKLLKV